MNKKIPLQTLHFSYYTCVWNNKSESDEKNTMWKWCFSLLAMDMTELLI